jgi:FixJ family two-component response regulator
VGLYIREADRTSGEYFSLRGSEKWRLQCAKFVVRPIVMSAQRMHIFFVDDEPCVRGAAQRAMESAGMRVNVFSSGLDCLAALSHGPCDVLITDIRIDGMDGISLLHEVKRRFPWLPAIVVTAYGDIPLVVAAIKAGAAEFIEKPLDRQELLSAIHRAVETAARPNASLQESLSESELQVLCLVLDGRTTREIASTLSRSARTIEAHRHNVMRKLDVRNVAQLVQRANALGLGTCDRR